MPFAAITGPAGTPGTAGPAGADGKSVELQKTATAIQWRLAGGTWADLISLSSITGPAGATGAVGPAGTPGANAVYRHGATTGLNLKIYTASEVTSANGAVTFTIPAGYFSTVTWADPVVIRDTNVPANATFAQVRSLSTTSCVVQCFESKTTGVLLLNTMVEGLELSGAGITVQLAVYGY